VESSTSHNPWPVTGRVLLLPAYTKLKTLKIIFPKLCMTNVKSITEILNQRKELAVMPTKYLTQYSTL
jgi:hypothetical protein